MANVYCTYAQLEVFYDVRTLCQLTSDDDSGAGVQATAETILDAAGSWMDSVIGYRATVTVGACPPILTRLVAGKAMKMLLARRNKAVEGVDKDAKEADDWAEKLGKGLVVIPTYAPPQPSLIQSSTGSPEVSRTDAMSTDTSFPAGVQPTGRAGSEGTG